MKKLLSLLMTVLTSLYAQAQYKIDSTFNMNGTNEFTQYAGNIVNGDRLAYTADNDIIVAGRWNDQLTVWKYKQSGSLDASFGHSGLNYIPMPAGVSTWVKAVLVQNDGKIVVLAEAELWSPSVDYTRASMVIARFLPDGTIDSTFQSTGFINTRLINSFEYHPVSLAYDSTANALIVGGWAIEYGAYSCPIGSGQWFVAKYLSDGALDNTFHSTGFIQSTSGALAQTYPTTTPMAIVLDAQPIAGGKILAAGIFNGLDSAFFSFRLKPDGNYDSTYAFNGINVTRIDSFHIATSPSVTYARILNDESIIFNSQYLLYGTAGAPDSTIILHVYKKDNAGNTQTSFGNSGFLTFRHIALRNQMAIDDHNRIIYCWYNSLPAGTQTIYFKRLNPNGSIDGSFGTGGIFTSRPVTGDTYMNSSTMNDIIFNKANDDISLVSFRSATYDPATFRIHNYSLDPNYIPTGINNANTETNFVFVYPNPATEAFTIATTTNGAYKMYDITGSMIVNGKLAAGANKIELPADFAKGIYFVQVVDAVKNVTTKRLLVQ